MMNEKYGLDKQKTLNNEGMRFFGKMSASATHEIKNTLAIINENAGLLEDLIKMAETGHSLPLEKVYSISGKVKKQVRRADETLKKLNRFSHSVDSDLDIIDLQKTVHFVVDFGSRLIQRTGCTIQINKAASPMLISANLFYVEHLIWRAIESVCYDIPHEDPVSISFRAEKKTPSIWFSTPLLKDKRLEELFKSERDQELMSYLGVTIYKNINERSFGLLWSNSN